MRRFAVLGLFACLSGGVVGQAWPAAFTAGNLIVYQVGDGVTGASTAATSVVLSEIRLDGTLVQSIAMPTAVSGANKPLTASDTGSEGLLTRSANGQCLVVPGYAAVPGTATVKASTASTNNRVIGFVAADGTIDTSTILGSAAFSTDAIRAAISNDCTQTWANGNGDSAGKGVWYAAKSGSATRLNATNAQGGAIAGAQLHTAFSSGTLNKLGTGLPSSGLQTATVLPGLPVKNFRGIAFLDLDGAVAGPDLLYAANNSDGTIAKFSFDGTTWIARGTLAAAGAHGLSVMDIGGGSVALVFTDGTGNLSLLVDRAGRTGNLAGTPAVLRTHASNAFFYGVAPSPETVLPAAAPDAPTAPSTSGLGSNGFTAQWSAPSGGQPVALYVVELSTDDFASVAQTQFVYATTSFAFSGLTPSTAYKFRVRAVNSAGASASTTDAAVSTPAGNTAPVITGLTNNRPLSGVIGDASDPAATVGLSFTVSDDFTAAGSLSIVASSSNPAVVPNDVAHLVLSNVNGAATIKIIPAGVGYADITVTVTDNDGAPLASSRTIKFAASANTAATPTTRWYTGRSDASTAIVLDANSMIVGDDENPALAGNALHVFGRNASGAPLAQTHVDGALDLGNVANCSAPGVTGVSNCSTDAEVDIEASFRLGNRIYVTGSHSNSKTGKSRADRWRFFAADVSGAGSATALTPAGYYKWLREDMRNWDAGNAHGQGAGYFGLVASSDGGTNQQPEKATLDGFSIEGLSTSPDNSAAWFAFRSPLVGAPGQAAVSANSASGRTHALIVPVTNYAALAAASAGGSLGSASFGAPIRLDLNGRAIREIRKNAANQYLIIAGPPDGASGVAPKDFRLYSWDGSVSASGLATNVKLRNANLASFTNPNMNCSAEGIVDVPLNLDGSGSVDIVSDCGDVDFYGDASEAKSLPYDEWKKFRVDQVSIAALITAPAAFAFVPVSGAALNAESTSNAIVVTSIETATTIAITGGTYAINGGAYTSASGTVNLNDSVTVRLTAASAYATPVSATLNIGGVTGTFSVTTAAAVTNYTNGGITAVLGTGAGSAGFTRSAFIPLSGGPGSPPGNGPAGYTFPYGLFDFSADGFAPGSTLTLTVTYPGPLPANTLYWKYGPTAANHTPHWYILPATINGNTVTFSIVDGGLGDDDLSANGVIVDQGGPGVPIGAMAIPASTPSGLLLLVLCLIGFAAAKAGRRKV